MSLPSTLTKNVKMLAAQSGWSIYNLATAADVDYSFLYRILNGKRNNIRLETLEKLAYALEVEPQELITEKAKKQELKLGGLEGKAMKMLIDIYTEKKPYDHRLTDSLHEFLADDEIDLDDSQILTVLNIF